MACCPIFWPLTFYGKTIIPLWSRWGVGMGERWERNWTILVLRETVGYLSTSSGVKMSRSSHQSLAMWPWTSYLTKNGAKGLNFPFGGRLEQDNSCEAFGSVSCTWCSAVLSEGQQVLEGVSHTCPLQMIKTISSYRLEKNLSITLWSPNHLRPIFTLPSVSEEMKCPCNPRFLHSVTVGSTFTVSLVLTLSASMDTVILNLELLFSGSKMRKSGGEGSKASERHPLSIPGFSLLVCAKYPLTFLIFTQTTSQQPL